MIINAQMHATQGIGFTGIEYCRRVSYYYLLPWLLMHILQLHVCLQIRKLADWCSIWLPTSGSQNNSYFIEVDFIQK